MTELVVIPSNDLDTKLFDMVERAFKNPVLRTDNEIQHEPVTIAYAAVDLNVERNTVIRMAKRGELEMTQDRKITFKSLDTLKRKRHKSADQITKLFQGKKQRT